MKYITLAATAALTGTAMLGTTVVMAQASFGVPTAPKPGSPRTNFTGGFPFGFVSQSPQHHDGRGFRHRRGGHRGFEIGYVGYVGDGDGYADTIPMSDEPGYFSTGGSVTFDGVTPVYQYDRSYPYEHYRGETGSARINPGLDLAGGSYLLLKGNTPAVAARGRCQVQNVRDEASGRQVQVRICRRS